MIFSGGIDEVFDMGQLHEHVNYCNDHDNCLREGKKIPHCRDLETQNSDEYPTHVLLCSTVYDSDARDATMCGPVFIGGIVGLWFENAACRWRAKIEKEGERLVYLSCWVEKN